MDEIFQNCQFFKPNLENFKNFQFAKSQKFHSCQILFIAASHELLLNFGYKLRLGSTFRTTKCKTTDISKFQNSEY